MRKRDFFDFVDDAFYLDRRGQFLKIIQDRQVKVKDLRDFFDEAGYEVSDSECQVIIDARDELINGISTHPGRLTY